jgi:hypothetical protein
MAVLAFSRQRYDLLNLHRDIDKLIATTTSIGSGEWHPGIRKEVDNAKAIYDQILTRCAAITMSPEEESVMDLKLNRAKSRLSVLGQRCG